MADVLRLGCAASHATGTGDGRFYRSVPPGYRRRFCLPHTRLHYCFVNLTVPLPGDPCTSTQVPSSSEQPSLTRRVFRCRETVAPPREYVPSSSTVPSLRISPTQLFE